jgi:hypothetical protein
MNRLYLKELCLKLLFSWSSCKDISMATGGLVRKDYNQASGRGNNNCVMIKEPSKILVVQNTRGQLFSTGRNKE